MALQNVHPDDLMSYLRYQSEFTTRLSFPSEKLIPIYDSLESNYSLDLQDTRLIPSNGDPSGCNSDAFMNRPQLLGSVYPT
jgi:hypothetical protein